MKKIKKYILIATLSEVYETGQRGRTKEERVESATLAHSNDDKQRDDVLTKTAN